jgi:hypothetical protein
MYTCDKCGYNTGDSSNFKRHRDRKTPCKPETKRLFTVNHVSVSENKVVCTRCDKTMFKTNFKRHTQTCTGVPKNTCEYCFKTLQTRQGKCTHKKTCKHKPVPEPEPVRRFFGATENVDSYVQAKNEQFKYLVFDVGTLMDLLFFNADHPENQMVRKSTSSSNMIEFYHDNRWLAEHVDSALPKLLQGMSKLAARFIPDTSETQLYDTWSKRYLNKKIIQELLYNRTKNGPEPEANILMRLHSLSRIPLSRLVIDQ